MSSDPAVIVIGAGVAGLAGACQLGRTGIAVHIIEARDRVGGRVFTHVDPVCDCPIELGAEFIHGKPPEIWELLRKTKTDITEVQGDAWCAEDDRLSPYGFWNDVDEILQKMDDSKPDESFAAFLDRCCRHPKPQAKQRAKQRAQSYVSGFNAADPALVGVHWLVKEMRAEEKIEGARAFRCRNGYKDLLDVFQQELKNYNITVQTETVVQQVHWKAGNVKVDIRDKNSESTLEAPRVLITLPLALLKAPVGQAGVVQFTPELPRQKKDALDRLEMGKVIRVTLRFRERFWDSIKPPGARSSLSNMSFLFGQDDWFPTWWTANPAKSPIITGWAPFRCAERLSGKSHSFVVEYSLQTLSTLLRVSQSELQNILEDAHFHDWQTDPFSRGAYSYGKVGANEAQQVLTEPIHDTLYFAGEATDTTGNNGTVHGAIASGYRAAKQILDATDTRLR
ncbi:MAG: FAD-dependent oxidoreductase [Acidobacteriia bacterium]|nr:FAD-dependent oxidoreductase [Terriglobia bacterium]